MANFFKSLFFGESEESEEEKRAKNFDVLKYDGIKALKMGKANYAIRCFNEALKLQEDVEILEHLVNAYTREERMEDAVNTTTSMLEVEPENVQVLLLRARLNYVIEKYAEVVADCEQVIRLDVMQLTAYLLQGRAKRFSGDLLGALVILSQAIQLKGDFSEALLLRAEILLELKNYQDGLEDIEKVVQLLPEEEHAYLVRGQLLEAMGQAAKAEADYRYILELNPFSEQAYLRLGTLYLTQKQLKQAIALFDEAIELKPDFAQAYHERGGAKLMLGDKEGGVADIQQAVEFGQKMDQIEGSYSNFEEMYQNRPL